MMLLQQEVQQATLMTQNLQQQSCLNGQTSAANKAALWKQLK
ncbi:hypothetical protein SLEP1_g53738 [Rubroshorea leprosula]|uniref:Uncharacterized protein n=1 Tax=Rubroshorea leprosula TaxID=152421 RepID=A0AAV5MC35_9ROSI|nr:hypothetical protein SLEP1_g53738 [Rubroshorea leprosula]